MAQSTLRCPDDQAVLEPVVGSESTLFRCTECFDVWRRGETGELERALPAVSSIAMRMIPDFLITDVTLSKLEASSTGVVDRLANIEASLDGLALRLTGTVEREELSRIRQDLRAAADGAQAAQGGTRLLQSQLGDLRRTFEELNLGSLRSEVDSLATLVRKHLADHKAGNV